MLAGRIDRIETYVAGRRATLLVRFNVPTKHYMKPENPLGEWHDAAG